MEAPDLMKFEKNDEGYWQCRFVRQPQNQTEEDQACKGVWASCCGAAAYRGKDMRIIERIAVLNANKGKIPESLGTGDVFPKAINEQSRSQRPVISTPNSSFLEQLFRRLK